MTELEPTDRDAGPVTDDTRAGRREASKPDPVEAELIPEEVQEAIARRVEMHLEHYSSPHPHPDHLERFAKLYPKAPEIVFEAFREQGEHRRRMERAYMQGNLPTMRRISPRFPQERA